ncbi:hypothetical protein VNO80_13933 [Phaseolus coccineus]|uniref:Cytochrome P450 n=1 Tax=Phaseolus coccineus TaxID=3886 RepID=A0AAN9N2G1_PHACN
MIYLTTPTWNHSLNSQMDLVANYLNTTTIGLLSLILFCFFVYGLFKFSQGKEAPTVACAWPILGHLPLLSGSKTPHRTDTINTVITWTISLVLRNPLVLEKVKDELDIYIGKEKCVSEYDISKLTYLQAIVKESLRLYPPGPLSTPREFTENWTLRGYNIKKGTRLITNLWKIHTDNNVWENPLEFKPERFLTTHKDIDVKGHHHFELLPFGGGRRMCPGTYFGLQMVHFILASFLHSFEILSSSPDPIDMTETFGLTNTNTPLDILIKPRLSLSYYENN